MNGPVVILLVIVLGSAVLAAVELVDRSLDRRAARREWAELDRYSRARAAVERRVASSNVTIGRNRSND